MSNFEEKEFCREQIIEMVKEIENLKDLKMIYGMTEAAYKNIEKADGC